MLQADEQFLGVPYAPNRDGTVEALSETVVSGRSLSASGGQEGGRG